MPIASLNVKATRLASSDAATVILGCRGKLHALSARSRRRHVIGSSFVPTRAHVTSPSSAHAVTGAVRSLACCGAGRDDDEGHPARRADACHASCLCAVRSYDVHLVGKHLAGASAVAAVTTRHEVADVVVPAVVVQMVDAQITSSHTPVSDGPCHVLAAPVARMGSRPDGVVEHHTVLGHQSVGSRQRMIRSVDILVPRSRHNEGWYQ